ncbi:hypothetical protein A2U01_0050591, partial [Trifolium medium]|nr:hypothetical protein [Trifolium medium]
SRGAEVIEVEPAKCDCYSETEKFIKKTKKLEPAVPLGLRISKGEG